MKFTYLYIIILILSLVTIASAAVPVASFTSNVTTGTTYPLVVWFNDTSTNAPQVWNWSFGDGRWFNTTNAALKNTTYQYSVAGKYAVSLLVNNTDGSDTKTVADYINLTSDNDDNLLIWLHMNGIEGSTVFTGEKGVAWTTMGAAHICTITYVFGGASGNFTGAKSYIYTPSTPILNFSTGAGEIEMWVKPMSSGSGVSLIKRGNPAQTAGWGVYHSTSAADSSGWVFWMGDQVTGATNTFTLPIGSWSHLVLSADPLGNNKVYVNGTLVATKSGMTANYDTNNPIYIGYRSSPVKYFDGYIDELRASKIERWKANFTPPYAQYAGVLETIYPDINPNSTFRYKTNPGDVAYLDNITPRNRTVQIQNITNTSYVLGSVTWNALIGYVKSVQLNLTYYPTGMTLVSSSIDNTLGVITFNISKPTGFSPGTDRASILDYTVIYYNYTDMSSIMPAMAFGYGYLINSTTLHVYPVHTFLMTLPTLGDWNFTANFSVDNLAPQVSVPVNFVSTFNGSYPNRWNWSFGDGTFNNGTNSTISHIYTTTGLKTVTLTEYLWQNTSVTNTTIKTSYVDVYEEPPIVSFITNFTPGRDPITIQFNGTSTGCVTAWNWTFNNVTGNNTEIGFSTAQNFTHVFTIGNYSIKLNASNNYYYNTTTIPYFINVSQMLDIIIVNFTALPNSGADPLVVRFNDTSIGCVTAWNWTFNNVTGNNTEIRFNTLQNFMYTFNIGNYSIKLNASNSDKYNISTIAYFINVSATATPMTDFTSIQSGSYPAVTVVFTDTSLNSPTTWYWIFGDGNTSTLQNPTNIYTWCGDFTVEFRSENSAGFNWKNKTDDVSIACPPKTTSEKLATKVMDTQNIIVIGVLLVIAAGITVYTVTLFTKKSG